MGDIIAAAALAKARLGRLFPSCAVCRVPRAAPTLWSGAHHATATAARCRSVSVVTFAAGSKYLRTPGIDFGGHMAAVLALMETPAILAARLIVGTGAKEPVAR